MPTSAKIEVQKSECFVLEGLGSIPWCGKPTEVTGFMIGNYGTLN